MPSRLDLSLASGLVALASFAAAGPCDIYATGKTPCVAAFSTTRALYSNYNGNLYQVKRGSDNTTQIIKPLAAGGVANAGTQDTFCQSTTCLITIIYDQSGNGNNLQQAPGGGAGNGPAPGGYDNLAVATSAPVTVNGTKAYGVFIQPQTGYRQDKTKNIATYDQPEGMYAVLDGTHWNSDCCFDFGNVEVGANTDNGNVHMETLFLGGKVPYNGGYGDGSGPWIMSDMENGVFSGVNLGYNSEPTVNYRFTTAIMKGQHNQWALRGGNAVSGGLSIYYSGVRPSGGYLNMSKEGGIVLGGVLTSGYPLDNIEAYVQADIVQNAKYTTASQTSGAAVEPGSTVSLQTTSSGSTKRGIFSRATNSYISHALNDSTIITQQITSTSNTALKQSASWTVHSGLGNSACISFESVDVPGSFIRHSNAGLKISSDDGTKLMHEDATFCPQTGLNGQGNSIKSWSYPTKMVRVYQGKVYIADNGGPNPFDLLQGYNDDASFVVGDSWA
ncbi:carbohydrate-binding module family 42 protein [Zasmidium cellare ATCC 36951]|uniref:Alpha-L-arabinofuranosidase n=1 Tax=Zasmidium cellare ATCC 36951 TaxID=1080233 RepID=A0A6A6C3R1_ZASCE|nr:carbohydrate-binding module family 42 protein [Zasmidium cellare ATCC 36951]KAF2161563.1 carbohydrate-binding module family 42 protein [Zasmidium cellare ATCC 36951]